MHNGSEDSGRAFLASARIAIIASSLIVFIPSIISDSANLTWLNFASFTGFFVTKLTVWLLLPTAVLMIIGMLFSSRSIVFWIVVWFLMTGIAITLKFSLGEAALFALVMTGAWFYAISILNEYAFVPGIAGIIVLLWIWYSRFGFGHGDTLFIGKDVPTNILALIDAPHVSGLEPPLSTHVIIFDELSKAVLIKDGKIDSRFPNFERLARESIIPERATTNFDLTSLAIPTMLSGHYVDYVDDPERFVHAVLAQTNLFDMITPNRLSIWGPAVLPYCRALRFKTVPAYCLDDYNLQRNMSLAELIEIDLWRLMRDYLIRLPTTILSSVAGSKYVQHIGFVHAIDRRLNRLVLASDFVFSKFSLQFELERLKDYVKRIGAVKGGFNFYHSSLPHFPFVVDKELSLVEVDNDVAFHLARSEKDLQRIQQRYIAQVQAADTVLGIIVDAIKKNDPNSLIVVTADHGAASNFRLGLSRAAGTFIPEVVDIPLMIALPADHPFRYRSTAPYQHIDFLPTIFDLLNFPADPSWQGRSIFGEASSPFYYRSKQNKFFEYKQAPLG